jgi:hypothetical protein
MNLQKESIEDTYVTAYYSAPAIDRNYILERSSDDDLITYDFGSLDSPKLNPVSRQQFKIV